MSFNIPIIFDDFGSFDLGDLRSQGQGRRNYHSSKRQPSLFEHSGDADFFNDFPTRKQHYDRPSYRVRQSKMRQMPEENRFEDEEGVQEDVDEHRRVRQEPSGNVGYDGWDIPVQHMDKTTRAQSKHQQMPKQNHNDTAENQESKQAERKLNKGKNTKQVPSDAETKTENVKTAESVKTETDKKLKVAPEGKMKRQSPDDPTAESSSQTTAEDENIEIPITYSPPKNTRRRLSKRLSQCDPPPLADIKLARIQSIVQKTEGIDEQISEFSDLLQTKKYLLIGETLMRILLDLDTVDSEGIDLIRKARKEGVRTVQNLVDKLENKLEENKRNS